MKHAKKLYEEGFSIRNIALCLGSGTRPVNKWVSLSDEELEKDNRGWKKGKPRKYTQQQKGEIKRIRPVFES